MSARAFILGSAALALVTACGSGGDDGRAAELASTGAQPPTFAYAFDPSGLATKVTNGATTYAIARTGDTLKAGSDTYSYDALGRVTAIDGATLAYGPDSQIDHVAAAGKTVSYVYDEEGHRIAKAVNGTTVAAYIEEGYLTATELDEPVHVAGHLVGTLNNGQFVLLASDVRGTVQADSDGSSRIASPFGARALEPDSAAEVDYADSAFDADIGGVRMGVRDYDPRTARFLQPDPLYLGDPERCVNSPVDCGLYTYARSSPATYVDPTGNEPETTESASAAERVANASRGAAHTAEHLAKHDGEKLVRQGYQFLMKSTEQFGEHSEAWYKGAHEFFEWGEHVAKRGEALGHKIEIAGAVLSGLDKAHETLKEHPGQYGRAARNGAVAGGVDLGLGLGVPALLVAVACPECAVGYGILYVGDGIYGAIKGHNATSALTNGIIHRIDRATERKSIAPRVPEHGAATIPTPPHH